MPEKSKILIIDDDRDLVETLKTILEAHNFSVSVVYDGEEGLERIKEANPNLIILDIMMQTKGEGFWIAQKLKSKDPKSEYVEYSHIPIIVLTAIQKKTEFKFSLEEDKDYLPVDDFIDKPIQPEKLLEKIEALLN